MLVQINGLDCTKEMKYRVGLPDWLARRGVSSLVVDQPGTGEALRLQGLHAGYDSEVLGEQSRRLARDAQRRRSATHRPARRLARRLLLSARRRLRAALRLRRRLGRQPRLARRAEEAAGAGGRISRAALLGARALGLGREGHGRLHAHRRGRAPGRRARAHQGAVPRHARREGLADSGCVGAPHLRAARQQSEARAEDLHAAAKAACSTRSFDNSINAGHYIADWVAETLGGRTA